MIILKKRGVYFVKKDCLSLVITPESHSHSKYAVDRRLFAFVGFLRDSSSIISFVDQWRGQDKEPLAVVQARLKPFRVSPVAPANQDNVFIQLQLRNYGKDPVYLTSAKIEVSESNTAKVGKAAVTGMCALTDNPNANKPIKVEPGATVWIRVSDSVHLSNYETPNFRGEVESDSSRRMPPLSVPALHGCRNLRKRHSGHYG